jgi:hypothetical protein
MNAVRSLFLAAILLAGAPLHAVTYTVNDTGSGGDSNPNDNTCSTATPANGSTCTLRAAIQEANGKPGPHTIKFAPAVTRIALSANLPQVTAPVTFDGTNAANVASGGRVEIDGSGPNSCFVLTDVTTASNPNGARGSTVKNFVIRRCSGDGVSLSGNGYTVSGNRIGTNVGADSGSSASDANSGAGISVSGTVPVLPAPPMPGPPSLSGLLATLPQGIAGVTALQASLQAALSVIANPTIVTGNVVSGNTSNGISIYGQGTVNTIVFGNIVGLSQNGLSAIPNGRGPGSSVNRAGIRISGTAYGNFIGPGNIVSGNLGDGIALDPGQVVLPNFVAGNLVGLGSAPTSVGNAENGISIDTKPKTSGPGANNPTGIAAIIGPANTFSDNQSTAPSADLDVTNADTSGGMLLSAASTKVRVFANVFGLATFPAGSTPLGQLNYGNSGNGIVITTPDNEVRNNIILANGRHGILLRGNGTTGNIISGNYIGVSVPTGLAALVSLGNVGDGIHIDGASSTRIGGPANSDANFIAGNRRNGIALRNGSTNGGWANLLQRNRIYGNAQGGSGIGIDLERVANGSDPLDQLQNPGTNYTNFDQHRPAICGGANDPPPCAAAQGPSFDGASTTLRWTVSNRPNASAIRIEFFALAAGDTDMTFLGETVVGTDAAGLPTGAGCVAGLCSSSVGGSVDSTGRRIVATSTDLFPTDVPPTGDQPPAALTPANNTSEFSDPAIATRKLAIVTAAPLPGGTTSQPYNLAFNATGGSGQYVNWIVSNGNAPTGLVLAPATGVLGGTATAAGTFNFTVQVTDSVGATAIGAYAITISAQPPLVITTPSPLTAGTVGSAYSRTFTASGGSGAAGNWQLASGDLPAGLALAAATGVLSGTPTAVGSFDFNVQVTDAAPTTVQRAYSLVINPAPVALAISTATPLPAATAGSSYSATLAAIGGSGSYVGWSITAGQLPAGIQLNPLSGVISGTPSASGTADFTVRVTDSAAATASKAFTLAVSAAVPPASAPVLTASPSVIDFGGVNVGRSAIANVVLRNIGAAALSPLVLAAGPGTEFVTDPGTCNVSLAAGATCTMSVTFTPSAGGGTSYAGSSFVCKPPVINGICISIVGGTGILARLRFSGLGTGTLARVAPRRIDFGTQLVGTQTNVVVSITNPTSSLQTFNPTLVTSNPTVFSVPTNTCGLGLIGAGATCTVTFRFTPAVPGAAAATTRIRIAAGAISESYDIDLAGTGLLSATPSYTTPMTLDFGAVNVGSIATIAVSTRNAAGVPLSVVADPFGTSDSGTWSRVPQAACLAPLANAAICRHDYSFAPRQQGGYSINTRIAVTGTGVNQSVPLSLTGTGVGALVEVSPQDLDFGNVAVGATVSATASITNTSVDALTRTFSGAAPFQTLSNCPASLAPGATCLIGFQLIADSTLTGTVLSETTLLFENTSTGNAETIVMGLRAQVVDGLFLDGFE